MYVVSYSKEALDRVLEAVSDRLGYDQKPMYEADGFSGIWVLELDIDPRPDWDVMNDVVYALKKKGVAWTSFFEDHDGSDTYYYYEGKGYDFHAFNEYDLLYHEEDSDEDLDKEDKWIYKNAAKVSNYHLQDLIRICDKLKIESQRKSAKSSTEFSFNSFIKIRCLDDVKNLIGEPKSINKKERTHRYFVSFFGYEFVLLVTYNKNMEIYRLNLASRDDKIDNVDAAMKDILQKLSKEYGEPNVDDDTISESIEYCWEIDDNLVSLYGCDEIWDGIRLSRV